VGLGLVLGTTMTLATYPMFHLAVRVVPALRPAVRALYRAADGPSLHAISWVAVLVLAEELLFRGALLDALERRTQPAVAAVLSVTAYALAQLGSGSLIVFLLALSCGAIWTRARRYSGSLVVSTISHLIWTECLILLFPVT
jgi:membrane protease YdiL (CAAX protease family)